MHYGNKEQLENNSLNITVYKHKDLVDGKFDYDLCSIVECKYVNPFIIGKFISCFQYICKDKFLDEIKEERFYLICLRFTGFSENEFDVLDIKELTDDISKNPETMLSLH